MLLLRLYKVSQGGGETTATDSVPIILFVLGKLPIHESLLSTWPAQRREKHHK